MDPVTAAIMAAILAALVVNTGAAAVTDVIAQARGQTPPSLEKWRARQAAKVARGEKAERDPGPWRRRWRNAVAYRMEKAALKHRARMELLQERSPELVDRHKERLRKRIARWERLNERIARWGGASWEKAKAAVARRQAEPESVEATEPELIEDGPDAEVLPFRRPDKKNTSENDQDEQPVTPAADDNEEEEAAMAEDLKNTSATEITDLDTAITYSGETAKYADTVSSTLEDILAQISAAASGLLAEADQYEQAKANLADEGFGPKLTARFDTGAEALRLAAEALKVAGDRVQAAGEQVAAAGSEMRAASQAFSDQLAVSESVGAAQADAGVSKRTAFYSPA